MSSRISGSASAGVGLTDYGFLYSGASTQTMFASRVKSRHSGIGEEEEAKRPSIDDFDSEIAIFKVWCVVCVDTSA